MLCVIPYNFTTLLYSVFRVMTLIWTSDEDFMFWWVVKWLIVPHVRGILVGLRSAWYWSTQRPNDERKLVAMVNNVATQQHAWLPTLTVQRTTVYYGLTVFPKTVTQKYYMRHLMCVCCFASHRFDFQEMHILIKYFLLMLNSLHTQLQKGIYIFFVKSHYKYWKH